MVDSPRWSFYCGQVCDPASRDKGDTAPTTLEHSGTVLSVPDPLPARLGRTAMIARWKPVHLGHAAVLDALAERSDRVVIGIGSSNRYDLANPFSAAETRDMLAAVLTGHNNVSLVDVPDLGHGPRWRAMVVETLGTIDLFVTANAYVRSLLCSVYPVVHPARLVAPDRRVAVDGTMVRKAMARGDDWRPLVPEQVARLIEERGLVARFRLDFGLETLALDAPGPT